ncbi:ATP-dependent helicase HrpA [Thiogranum longum]|uniref:ATP-dependent helicase HrpA n=1 Tax=Thiogranum longum TaxID=1537524 RepID=A0A4R1HB60_9GAMM|nr:ATP-dependent RNA helicase HrpA [Thiogranum longum]TCK19194.1 ATP-dependent helicase HrpA [Thiogranum longum]
MKESTVRPGRERLDELQHELDDCLARDIPGLTKKIAGLHRRLQRCQPIDHGLLALNRAIEMSRQQVVQRHKTLPKPEYALSLPVVEQREAILEKLDRHQVVILCGETGSGKTTQLPKLCLELGRGTYGKIGHTQPRRIAARSLAARIAEELHCPLGEAAGYKVRFQDRVRDSSFIKIMTDGILLAEIQSDPELREYDTLIIDEAHERSLNVDFMLGYLRRLLPKRPDLKVIITSATIDPQRFSRHFGNAPVVEVSGRTFPVEMRYRPVTGEDEDQRDRSRGQAIIEAVDELAREGPGDILVFLPGERAIRETSELLRKHHPARTEILPLYARLSARQQGEVFRSHKGRRIVLATNVAETSLTVPGIRYVIDTGLARVSRYSYRTKVQRLPIEAVSQASANQRSGRCGRVQAGICIRLYSEEDFLSRAEFTAPEIHRTNLAAVILQMASLKLGDVDAFPFVDPPDTRLVRDGYKLLHELGAVDVQQQLTPSGRELCRLPLDPRLARIILAANEQNCLSEALVIAAVLEAADPRDRPLDKAQAADEKHALFRDDKSDFLSYLKLWRAWKAQSRHLSQNKLRKWCREHFISWLRMREWADIHRQLHEQVTSMGMRCNSGEADYQAIHRALISGLLGNIAFQVEPGEYQGARNLRFKLFPGSTLARKKPGWVVAAELVETGRRYLRTVAVIDPAWVEPLASPLLKHHYSDPHWEKKRARVTAFERVTLYGLPLVNRRKVDYGSIDPAIARSLFIRHALVEGLFNTNAAFAEHNRTLLAELGQLESKARRRDVLVDEEDLFNFFDERLPEDVYDGPRFNRWWKKVIATNPRCLHLDRETVMRKGAETVDEQEFPSQINVHGLQLGVRYHFSPGDEDDGVCIQVPLAMLNQLEPDEFDWLVPGLRQEKVTLLIKSLPKTLRRHFVPAPDFARAILQAVTPPKGDLLDALATQLKRMTQIDVPRSAWHMDLLPRHLFAWFELVDEQGKRIDAGRDLVALQQRYGEQAQSRFTSLTDSEFERSDILDWGFGRLPETVEITRAGITLQAWPALEKRDGSINLRLFDNPQAAAEAHEQGLLALFRQNAGRRLRDIHRSVPERQKQALWFAPLGPVEVLQADMEQAVLQAAFMSAGEPVRDETAYRQRLESGRARLLELAVEISRSSYEALQAFHQLSRGLKGSVSPQLLLAMSELRQQAGALVYPGFLSATPLSRLPRLAIYLRAAVARLERLPGNVERDRKHALQVQEYQSRFEQAQNKGGVDPEQLQVFRWLIEELRVSLFAQELGTVDKVSPQRLDKAWKALVIS